MKENFLNYLWSQRLVTMDIATTTNEKIRKSRTYIHWRKAVFKRDNYTCQCCGEMGGNLVAHHLESFNNNPKLRTTLENGTTTCENCHSDFHHQYGYGDNTKEQFEEFKGENTNGRYL